MDSAAAETPMAINWRKFVFLFLGIILFVVVYYSPPWPDAIDPMGKHFELSREAKGALAVFLLAGTWWVFEVVPIGVTSSGDRRPAGAVPDPPGESGLQGLHGPLGHVHLRLDRHRPGVHQDRAHPPDGLQDAHRRRRAHQHDLPRLLRGHRRPDPHHGPHRRGRDDLPAADGHLCPLRRGRQKNQVRQGPLHRHGLRGRRRQHHHPAGGGPRRRGHRLFQGYRRHQHLLFQALLLHVPHRLADGLSALGLFHDCSQAGKESDPRPAGQSQPTQRRAGRPDPQRDHRDGDRFRRHPDHVPALVRPAAGAGRQDRHHPDLDRSSSSSPASWTSTTSRRSPGTSSCSLPAP